VHPSLPYRTTNPGRFAEHVDWLQAKTKLVPFSAIPKFLHVASAESPIVALTFDDGYQDNHQFVLPLLAERSVPASFFVTAGFVDRDPATCQRFQELRRVDAALMDPMSWGQVREIVEAGMEVGSHSLSHPNLVSVSDPQLHRELNLSKQVIEDRIQCEVRSFAYPFGRPRVHIDRRVVEATRDAQYTAAASVAGRGVDEDDDLLNLPRIFAGDDSIDTLAAKVLGEWDFIGKFRELLPLAVLRRVSPRDFEY
jgi:peptidoglycan/xylan/chitin deacetylase (PgdA/CDA1 family)